MDTIFKNQFFSVFRAADSTESPILEETAAEVGDDQKPKTVVKYGELVILGLVPFVIVTDV